MSMRKSLIAAVVLALLGGLGAGAAGADPDANRRRDRCFLLAAA